MFISIRIDKNLDMVVVNTFNSRLRKAGIKSEEDLGYPRKPYHKNKIKKLILKMKTTIIDQKQACNQADRQNNNNKKSKIKSKMKQNPKINTQNCGIAYVITRIESTCISKVVLYKYNT